MKIGILGGTFDPIHQGHLYLARTGLEVLGLERVLFMVAHQSPHKTDGAGSSPFDRYAMVALDLLDEPVLAPCQWELERGSLSYTIDTARHFSRTHPEHRYCFLGGSDGLREFHLWRDHAALLGESSFLFLQRPGSRVDTASLRLAPELSGRIHPIDRGDRPRLEPGRSYLITRNAPPVSGTELRRMVAAGLPPDPEMVSPMVLRYIRKQRLYEA